jgi:hypothetical protein
MQGLSATYVVLLETLENYKNHELKIMNLVIMVIKVINSDLKCFLFICILNNFLFAHD